MNDGLHVMSPLPFREGNRGTARFHGSVLLPMPTYQFVYGSHAVCIHRHGS